MVIVNVEVKIEAGAIDSIKDAVAAMETESGETLLAHAEHACHEILPAMLAVRNTADTLEGIVADDLWPLATYQEMRFIK